MYIFFIVIVNMKIQECQTYFYYFFKNLDIFQRNSENFWFYFLPSAKVKIPSNLKRNPTSYKKKTKMFAYVCARACISERKEEPPKSQDNYSGGE